MFAWLSDILVPILITLTTHSSPEKQAARECTQRANRVVSRHLSRPSCAQNKLGLMTEIIPTCTIKYAIDSSIVRIAWGRTTFLVNSVCCRIPTLDSSNLSVSLPQLRQSQQSIDQARIATLLPHQRRVPTAVRGKEPRLLAFKASEGYS